MSRDNTGGPLDRGSRRSGSFGRVFDQDAVHTAGRILSLISLVGRHSILSTEEGIRFTGTWMWDRVGGLHGLAIDDGVGGTGCRCGRILHLDYLIIRLRQKLDSPRPSELRQSQYKSLA